MKGIDSWTLRAAARSATYGEIKEVIATVEASANSLDTYCTIVAVSNSDPCERAVVAAMLVIMVGSSGGGECKRGAGAGAGTTGNLLQLCGEYSRCGPSRRNRGLCLGRNEHCPL